MILYCPFQGVLLMGLENFLHSDFDKSDPNYEKLIKQQTCVSPELVGNKSTGHQDPVDYSSYLTALAAYWYAPIT